MQENQKMSVGITQRGPLAEMRDQVFVFIGIRSRRYAEIVGD